MMQEPLAHWERSCNAFPILLRSIRNHRRGTTSPIANCSNSTSQFIALLSHRDLQRVNQPSHSPTISHALQTCLLQILLLLPAPFLSLGLGFSSSFSCSASSFFLWCWMKSRGAGTASLSLPGERKPGGTLFSSLLHPHLILRRGTVLGAKEAWLRS